MILHWDLQLIEMIVWTLQPDVNSHCEVICAFRIRYNICRTHSFICIHCKMDIFFMFVRHLSCSLSIESNVKLHIDAQCNCSDVCVSVAHAHLLNVYFTPNCGVILFTLPWAFVFVPEPNMTLTVSFKTILVDRSWPLVTTEKLAIAVSVSNQIVIEKLRTGFEHPSLNTQSVIHRHNLPPYRIPALCWRWKPVASQMPTGASVWRKWHEKVVLFEDAESIIIWCWGMRTCLSWCVRGKREKAVGSQSSSWWTNTLLYVSYQYSLCISASINFDIKIRSSANNFDDGFPVESKLALTDTSTHYGWSLFSPLQHLAEAA